MESLQSLTSASWSHLSSRLLATELSPKEARRALLTVQVMGRQRLSRVGVGSDEDKQITLMCY